MEVALVWEYRHDHRLDIPHSAFPGAALRYCRLVLDHSAASVSVEVVLRAYLPFCRHFYSLSCPSYLSFSLSQAVVSSLQDADVLYGLLSHTDAPMLLAVNQRYSHIHRTRISIYLRRLGDDGSCCSLVVSVFYELRLHTVWQVDDEASCSAADFAG